MVSGMSTLGHKRSSDCSVQQNAHRSDYTAETDANFAGIPYGERGCLLVDATSEAHRCAF